MLFFSTHNNTKTTELGYVELYESRNGVAKSKMFDQNSSKLDRFSHSIHTNSRTATKQTTIINTVTYTSTKHELLKTPFQNNNDGCVQTSAASDLTESSLDCKPSATETGILRDFDSYSMKDVVFNENEDAILAIGDVQRSKSKRIKLFED